LVPAETRARRDTIIHIPSYRWAV